MTSVAIIGNSHLTAFHDAAPQITAAHPEVELSFFGLDNQVFFRSKKLNGAALRVAEPVGTNNRQVIDPAGAHALDLGAFDLVLLASHGFYLRHLYKALGSFNVLGLRALDDHGPQVSQACVQDAMAAHVTTYTTRLRRFFPQADNAVVVQMPYPSVEAADLSDALAGLHAQPDRTALFEMFNTLVETRMFEKNLAYLPVPDAYLEGPFFTKPHYSRKAAMRAGAAPALTDHMHMNAEYAAGVFGHIHAAVLA